MQKKQVFLSFIFIFFFIGLIFPKRTYAVVPPDFIFNIGFQVAQIFSLAMLSFSAFFGIFYKFIKTKITPFRHKWILIPLSLIFILSISGIISYFYTKYKQKSEYQIWLQQSEQNNKTTRTVAKKDEADKLNIGNSQNQNLDFSKNKFVSAILKDNNDSYSKFIEDYYGNIAIGKLEQAYEMSKKAVDFTTFKNWYLMTTKITLDKLERIDEKNSSLELTLYEGNNFTRYGVLMTLFMQDGVPVRVEKSEVKILSAGEITQNKEVINNNKVNQEYYFYEANKKTNKDISNIEFQNITNSTRSDYLVLDARENIEYENGYFPNSLHIRFADLKAGRWIEIPKDKYIYVICWSGIRGKEVAQFLRTKMMVASYLENGANGWVAFGGKWIGNIAFGAKYYELKFQYVFNTDEVKQKVNEGVKLVDCREPNKLTDAHISGSVNIPIMYTPTIDMEKTFGQLPINSKVITVCDGYVNCFDAKVTGVELEKRGHEFLGRYNKPWEYGY